MLDLISSCEAIFLYFGGSVFILSILVWFAPHCFKLGVLTMIVGDIALAGAMAFPRRMTEYLLELGVPPSFFPPLDQCMIYGVSAGVGFFFLCLALYYLAFIRPTIRKLKQGSVKYDKNSPQAKFQSPSEGKNQESVASFKASVPPESMYDEDDESIVDALFEDEENNKKSKPKSRNKRARNLNRLLNDGESGLEDLQGNPLYAGVKSDHIEDSHDMRLSLDNAQVESDSEDNLQHNPLKGVGANQSDNGLVHGSAVLAEQALSQITIPSGSTQEQPVSFNKLINNLSKPELQSAELEGLDDLAASGALDSVLNLEPLVRNKHGVDLTDNTSHGDSIDVDLAPGAKVGDVLSAIDDGQLPEKLINTKPKVDLSHESSFSFADMFNSAKQSQSGEKGIFVDVTDDIAHNHAHLDYSELDFWGDEQVSGADADSTSTGSDLSGSELESLSGNKEFVKNALTVDEALDKLERQEAGLEPTIEDIDEGGANLSGDEVGIPVAELERMVELAESGASLGASGYGSPYEPEIDESDIDVAPSVEITAEDSDLDWDEPIQEDNYASHNDAYTDLFAQHVPELVESTEIVESQTLEIPQDLLEVSQPMIQPQFEPQPVAGPLYGEHIASVVEEEPELLEQPEQRSALDPLTPNLEPELRDFTSGTCVQSDLRPEPRFAQPETPVLAESVSELAPEPKTEDKAASMSAGPSLSFGFTSVPATNNPYQVKPSNAVYETHYVANLHEQSITDSLNQARESRVHLPIGSFKELSSYEQTPAQIQVESENLAQIQAAPIQGNVAPQAKPEPQGQPAHPYPADPEPQVQAPVQAPVQPEPQTQVQAQAPVVETPVAEQMQLQAQVEPQVQEIQTQEQVQSAAPAPEMAQSADLQEIVPMQPAVPVEYSVPVQPQETAAAQSVQQSESVITAPAPQAQAQDDSMDIASQIVPSIPVEPVVSEMSMVPAVEPVTALADDITPSIPAEPLSGDIVGIDLSSGEVTLGDVKPQLAAVEPAVTGDLSSMQPQPEPQSQPEPQLEPEAEVQAVVPSVPVVEPAVDASAIQAQLPAVKPVVQPPVQAQAQTSAPALAAAKPAAQPVAPKASPAVAAKPETKPAPAQAAAPTKAPVKPQAAQAPVKPQVKPAAATTTTTTTAAPAAAHAAAPAKEVAAQKPVAKAPAKASAAPAQQAQAAAAKPAPQAKPAQTVQPKVAQTQSAKPQVTPAKQPQPQAAKAAQVAQAKQAQVQPQAAQAQKPAAQAAQAPANAAAPVAKVEPQAAPAPAAKQPAATTTTAAQAKPQTAPQAPAKVAAPRAEVTKDTAIKANEQSNAIPEPVTPQPSVKPAADESRTHLAPKRAGGKRPSRPVAPNAQAASAGKPVEASAPVNAAPAQAQSGEGQAAKAQQAAAPSAKTPAAPSAEGADGKHGRSSLKSHFSQVLNKSGSAGVAARNVSALLNATRHPVEQGQGGAVKPVIPAAAKPAVQQAPAQQAAQAKPSIQPAQPTAPAPQTAKAPVAPAQAAQQAKAQAAQRAQQAQAKPAAVNQPVVQPAQPTAPAPQAAKAQTAPAVGAAQAAQSTKPVSPVAKAPAAKQPATTTPAQAQAKPAAPAAKPAQAPQIKAPAQAAKPAAAQAQSAQPQAKAQAQAPQAKAPAPAAKPSAAQVQNAQPQAKAPAQAQQGQTKPAPQAVKPQVKAQTPATAQAKAAQAPAQAGRPVASAAQAKPMGAAAKAPLSAEQRAKLAAAQRAQAVKARAQSAPAKTPAQAAPSASPEKSEQSAGKEESSLEHP